MLTKDLTNLQKLNIPITENGRVKVRGKTGRLVYVSDLSKASNRNLIAKYYKINASNLTSSISNQKTKTRQTKPKEMLGYELTGLRRMGIYPENHNGDYRLKVRSNSGRIVYLTNPSKPSNIPLVAKYYDKKISTIKRHLSPDFQFERDTSNFKGETYEWVAYEHFAPEAFYDELEKELLKQIRGFSINIQLGYDLIDMTDGSEIYYYPTSRTQVFDDNIKINSRTDIYKNVLAPLKALELAGRLNYPSSRYKLKAITGFKVVIHYRTHALGANIVIPDPIKKHQCVVNFPKTDNKCVLYCIAYHKQPEDTRRLDRLQAPVKEVFKQYCAFKGEEYSLKKFKSCEPIDIMEFDNLEECFEVRIVVWEMDLETLCVDKIRDSEKKFNSTIHILDYKSHAMYISNIDHLLKKYPCPKCGMIFGSYEKLRNHNKNRCEDKSIASYVEKPSVYRPAENKMKKLMRKYGVEGSHYFDHFIAFDFESILKPIKESHGEGTEYTHEHIPVSVSVSDSLSREVECFVNDDPQRLVEDMFECINKRQEAIAKHNIKEFDGLSSAIATKLDTFEAEFSSRMKGITDMKKARKENPELKKWLDARYKIDSDKKDLEYMCSQVPLLGFNSSRYDINLIKKHMFSVIAGDIKKTIKNAGYACISTKTLKILDICNYVPAGTTLDGYLTTYLGGCKCEDKIHCLCGKGKGLFCYDYLDSFERLNETQLPPKQAFDSKKKGTVASDEDYERLMFIWDHYKMKTLKDLLIWYNNLDVVPFIDAIIAQRQPFRDNYCLDMLSDAVSLPGLSEKVMYQTVYNNLDHIKREVGTPFTFPEKRLKSYIKQDEKAKRVFGLTADHVQERMKRCGYCCCYCLSKLDEDNASVDRIDNKKGHIDGNINICCSKCNVARKDMSINGFCFQKQIEYNGDKLIWSIDKEQGDIFPLMRNNIAGGPAIIFNRYAKRDETSIRGGKLCKKVIGYDANALYLWCIGNVMPCGRLIKEDVYDGILDDIMADRKFGFLECDIETPDHLKEYFSEMTPIFKNIEIEPADKDVIGEHMYEYNQSRKQCQAKRSRKLIGSYFGEKMLIYTPLLKWYIEHGLRITNTYCFIKASSARPYRRFMENVSQARRDGDTEAAKNKKAKEDGGSTENSKGMLAEIMKLVGNSAFGRAGMDKSKHKDVSYTTDAKKVMSYEHEHFNHCSTEELGGVFEITRKKRKILYNNPIHVAIAIYQLAKLRMLQFYYDCIDRYFDRSDFQYQEMDTDSAYIAFSDDHPFENLIKPELREHFNEHKYDWFPRDDTEEHANYDRRTPGLFKEEWRGNGMVSLSPKNYICFLPDMKSDKESYGVKYSAKGVQQANGKNSDILNPESFSNVVHKKLTMSATNQGFRIDKSSQSIKSYTQHKTGLNYYYDKRQVLSDGISTIPLPI